MGCSVRSSLFLLQLNIYHECQSNYQELVQSLICATVASFRVQWLTTPIQLPSRYRNTLKDNTAIHSQPNCLQNKMNCCTIMASDKISIQRLSFTSCWRLLPDLTPTANSILTHVHLSWTSLLRYHTAVFTVLILKLQSYSSYFAELIIGNLMINHIILK